MNTMYRPFSLSHSPRRNVGHAELTIGGIDPSKVNGNLTFAPVAVRLTPGEKAVPWVLIVSNIAVNGNTTSSLSQQAIMVIDSGTSNLVLQPNLTMAIFELISPDIKAHDKLGAFGLPCSQIDSISANISFTFTDGDGQPFVLTVPPEEFNVGPFDDDPETCQTLINALDFGGGVNILGASLLKHYYSVYDVENARIGFVPSNQSCTNGSDTPSNQSSMDGSGNANETHTTSSSMSLNGHICSGFSLVVVLLSTLIFV